MSERVGSRSTASGMGLESRSRAVRLGLIGPLSGVEQTTLREALDVVGLDGDLVPLSPFRLADWRDVDALLHVCAGAGDWDGAFAAGWAAGRGLPLFLWAPTGLPADLAAWAGAAIQISGWSEIATVLEGELARPLAR